MCSEVTHWYYFLFLCIILLIPYIYNTTYIRQVVEAVVKVNEKVWLGIIVVASLLLFNDDRAQLWPSVLDVCLNLIQTNKSSDSLNQAETLYRHKCIAYLPICSLLNQLSRLVFFLFFFFCLTPMSHSHLSRQCKHNGIRSSVVNWVWFVLIRY